MAYCTLADIEKYLDPELVVDLSDDDSDGIADPAVIAEAIAGADGDIDAYLTQYTTPIFPAPPILRKISSKIAAHYLFLRRKGAEIPEKWETDYGRTLELLEKIAAGDIKLGDDASGSETSGTILTGRGADEAHLTFENLGNF